MQRVYNPGEQPRTGKGNKTSDQEEEGLSGSLQLWWVQHGRRKTVKAKEGRATTK